MILFCVIICYRIFFNENRFTRNGMLEKEAPDLVKEEMELRYVEFKSSRRSATPHFYTVKDVNQTFTLT